MLQQLRPDNVDKQCCSYKWSTGGFISAVRWSDFHCGDTQACQPPLVSGEFGDMQHLCQYYGGSRVRCSFLRGGQGGCAALGSEGRGPDGRKVGFGKPSRSQTKNVGAESPL